MLLFQALISALSLVQTTHARAVFAHYMVGKVDEDHAHQDIEDAIAMGLDAFSLNIGYPQDDFVYPTLSSLFGYADYINSQGRNFKLLISMDLYAAGDHKHADGSNVNAFDYGDLFKEFLNRTSYYKGPNGKPFITTFADGGMHNDSYLGWKQTLNNDLYFVPDLDHTEGYNTSDPEWWKYWGPIFDGVTAWECAWTYRAGYGGAYPGDVSPDKQVIDGTSRGPGTKSHGKTYMAPLSSIQYKNAYATNVYRQGNINLPARMDNLLGMGSDGPDFIQVITWNDGPESHYIGNIWPEQNTDYDPSRYMSATKGNHKGWQPIVASFINAFKNGATSAAGMTLPAMTPSGQNVDGAIWYKTIMQSTTCPAEKPDGFEKGDDSVAYAVIVNGQGYSIEYNGKSIGLKPGMNYGTFDMQVGAQRATITQNGQVVLTAAGGPCSYQDCVDGIYNMNVEVVRFATDDAADVDCYASYTTSGTWVLENGVWTYDRTKTSIVSAPAIFYQFQPAVSTCNAVADLNSTDQWVQSGARDFLEYVMANTGPGQAFGPEKDGHLHLDKKLQLAYTNGREAGKDAECTDLMGDGGGCAPIELGDICGGEDGNIPAEIFYVRKAFDMYRRHLASLQSSSIVQQLDSSGFVDETIDQFGPGLLGPRADTDSKAKNILGIIGKVIGIIAPIIPIAAPEAEGLNAAVGVTGGVVSAATPSDSGSSAANLTGDLEAMKTELRKRFNDAFGDLRTACQTQAVNIFIDGDASKVPAWSLPSPVNDSLSAMGKVFDQGVFLGDPLNDTGLAAYDYNAEALHSAFQTSMYQRVLGMAINIAGLYIQIGGELYADCDFKFSYWAGGACHALESAGGGPNDKGGPTFAGGGQVVDDRSSWTTKVADELINNITDFANKHDFHTVDIIRSSELCQSLRNSFETDADFSISPRTVPSTNNMAVCTFDLPVIDITPYRDYDDDDLGAWHHSACLITLANPNNTGGGTAGRDYLPDSLVKPYRQEYTKFTTDWCFKINGVDYSPSGPPPMSDAVDQSDTAKYPDKITA